MKADEVGPWIVGVLGLIGAIAAGWWQLKIARTSPPSVAQGYGQLVADLRADLDRLRAAQAEALAAQEVAEAKLERLERDHHECLTLHEAAEAEIAALRAELNELRAKLDRPPSTRTRKDD